MLLRPVDASGDILPALSSLGYFSMDAMEAEIRKVPNVTHVLIRVNDGDITVDGIPAHTIACYVNNGNAGLIASVIWIRFVPQPEI